jgi:hypothetical protein
MPDRLPKPDQYGNYWLGGKGKGPAILKGRQVGGAADCWFACSGAEDGCSILFAGPDIRYFQTPEAALAALKEQVGR